MGDCEVKRGFANYTESGEIINIKLLKPLVTVQRNKRNKALLPIAFSNNYVILN